MTPEEIKRKRANSILRELIPEALSQLGDERLRGLTVTEVVCSKGRSDADVYLDPTGIDEAEQRQILKQLKKVTKGLEAYCLKAEGWYRSPKFHFKFDKELDRVKRMDELFAKIEKELKG
ncbi:MAG: 30S ribosome-binding factor RbfA [Hydrogenimonas sp.]|jgi:ribosome-binding factor A|nr:MAG: 30S ribosome-binding factor RbfA [Hydrogenimonas sp.]